MMSQNTDLHTGCIITSHKKHVNVAIDFHSPEIPHTVEEICGRETDLNDSATPLLNYNSNSTAIEVDSNSSGFASFINTVRNLYCMNIFQTSFGHNTKPNK